MRKKVSLNRKATLFLVATPIGNLSEVSDRTLNVLNDVAVIACEDTRNTLKLLSHFDIHTRMITYHNFNEKESTRGIIRFLEEGKDVALVSDAGYPLISDPGYELVNEVIRCGYGIVTVSGPNAALNALVASGLKTSHYLFYGFLNAKQSQARKELEELKDFPYTLIFYEAPHRIEKTLSLALQVFGDRKACLARELTKLHEEYHRGSLSELCNLKDLKGEMVLIIEGKEKQTEDIDQNELMEEIDQLVKEGMRTKEAVNQVAEGHQASKNTLYNAYLKRKKEL
ncbi:MAG: 16S rRNA (cytidine(1402)-2'-O)-methyltransferase [Erysipelotrichaceae bacterium]|nr:16S rRNA (cytidine(1402)-2'-O)-methyltransferase [Erysipelotrichaceae bacterium]MBR2533276.1 16S rRNA (cytidine(1402)-2'-O)-methyltransferase [Erysipelotrichaceae bacterium]